MPSVSTCRYQSGSVDWVQLRELVLFSVSLSLVVSIAQTCKDCMSYSDYRARRKFTHENSGYAKLVLLSSLMSGIEGRFA